MRVTRTTLPVYFAVSTLGAALLLAAAIVRLLGGDEKFWGVAGVLLTVGGMLPLIPSFSKIPAGMRKRADAVRIAAAALSLVFLAGAMLSGTFSAVFMSLVGVAWYLQQLGYVPLAIRDARTADAR